MASKFKTIVKRSEWLRGQGDGTLLDEYGKKCCLGFRCEQQGVSQGQMRNYLMPASIPRRYTVMLPDWLLTRNARTAVDDASRINDDSKLKDDEREAKLKEIFASQGEEIEFVD